MVLFLRRLKYGIHRQFSVIHSAYWCISTFTSGLHYSFEFSFTCFGNEMMRMSENRQNNDSLSDMNPATDSRWGIRMVMLDNLLRPVEPVLILVCASLYAGGAWGSFRVAEALVYLIYKISLLGLDRGVIWGQGQKDYAKHRDDILASVRLVGIASAVGAVVMLLISRFAGGSIQGLSLGLGDLVAQALALPMLALAELMYQANINRRKMFARIIGTDILIPFIVFGGAILGYYMGWHLSLSKWLLLGSFANFILATISFTLAYDVHWKNCFSMGMPSRLLLRYSLPFLSVDTLAGLIARVDLMLVGAFGGIEAVEVYNVIIMISRSLQAIRQSFDGLLLSAFSREGAQALTHDLKERMNAATWGIANLLGLALFLIAVWGETFLRLLHPEYQTGYWAFVSISAFVFLNAFGDMSGVMLQGLGKSTEYTLAQIAAFAANLTLNVLLVPTMGSFGGVLALGTAFILQGLLCQVFLWRSSGTFPWMAKHVRSIALLSLWLVAFGAVSALLQSRSSRIALSLLAVGSWAWLFKRLSAQYGRVHEPAKI